MSWVDLLLHGLALDGLFLYKALWSVLLGVAVTAVIDVLVDRDKLARLFGGRGAKSTGLATAAGAASSACTYGAITVAQSLFKKGASVEATYAFALAATNIVFELGILIYVLLGGPFLAGELVAGVLLVAGMWLLVRITLPQALFAAARKRLQADGGRMMTPAAIRPVPDTCGHPGPLPHTLEIDGTVRRFCSTQCRDAFARAQASRSLGAQLSSLGGWYRLAWRYTFTLQRIYKSVVGGFLVAGFVTLVPAVWLNVVFLPPTSLGAVLENAALGVLVGVFSFIASIGIVPFAAALWFSGAGFAGVLGVIIADNITIPVLGLWRRFYGTKAAAYTFAVFYTVMVLASVAVYYLFDAAGIRPRRASVSHLTENLAVHVDYTFWLTLGFGALTLAMFVVRRLGQRRGAEETGCPVCEIPLEQRHAAATRLTADGGTAYLCSLACAAMFDEQSVPQATAR